MHGARASRCELPNYGSGASFVKLMDEPVWPVFADVSGAAPRPGWWCSGPARRRLRAENAQPLAGRPRRPARITKLAPEPFTVKDDINGYHHLPLLTEGRVAVLRDGHPLAGRTSLTWADLAGRPWITTAADDAAWQSYARPPGHDGPDAVMVNTVDEYLEAVLAGQGVGLAPEAATRFYTRPGIRYVPVTDAQPSTIALAWRPDT